MVESGGVHGNLHAVAAVEYAESGIEYEGDDEARHRRVHHEADVLEEVSTGHGGCQHGGVAHWRHLVAEVSTGDDSTGSVRLGDAKCRTDTHQGNTDGGDGSPRRTGHDGDDSRDDTGARQEEHRRHNLHAVVYQRRNDAAYHPCCGHHADEQQQEDGDAGIADGGLDALLEDFPFCAVDAH